jgi:hypothetical protein
MVGLVFLLPLSGVVAAADSVGLYDPSNKRFQLKRHAESGVVDTLIDLTTSMPGPQAVLGDWDGDGLDSVGIYRPDRRRFALTNSQGSSGAELVFAFGTGGNQMRAIAGDWEGDGIDTVAAYDPDTGRFQLNRSTGTTESQNFPFGPKAQNLWPLAGDWDGDGSDGVAVYDPVEGLFYLKNETSGGAASSVFGFGPKGASWLPFAGDWNGDGIDTVALYAPETATFYLRNENAAGDADSVFAFGSPGSDWIPVSGAWTAKPPSATLSNGAEGRVFLEAEEFQAHDARQGIHWQTVDVTDHSGRAAMQALPTDAAKVATVGTAPTARLDYSLTVSKPGRYYLKLRAQGANGRSNSVHLGLDGVPQSDSQELSVPPGIGWTWNDTVRFVDIDTTGEHTLNMWMRESGVIVDGLVLSTESNLDPQILEVLLQSGQLQSPTQPGEPNEPPDSEDPTTPGDEPGPGDEPPTTPPDSSPHFSFEAATAVVRFEAEAYHGSAAVDGHEWQLLSDLPGYAGTGAMRAMPEDRVNLSSGYVGSSPRLDYRVNFPAAGSYFVWVRGHGPGGGSNSVHVGLNGNAVASAENIQLSTEAGYSWSSGVHQVTVNAAGVHTLNLWMRESGAYVDRLLVTPRTLTDPDRIGEGSDPSTSVELTWKANPTPVNGYRVYYGVSPNSIVIELADFSTNDPSFPAGAPKAEFDPYDDLGLNPGDQACFRLRAYDSTGVSGYTQGVCVKV